MALAWGRHRTRSVGAQTMRRLGAWLERWAVRFGVLGLRVEEGKRHLEFVLIFSSLAAIFSGCRFSREAIFFFGLSSNFLPLKKLGVEIAQCCGGSSDLRRAGSLGRCLRFRDMSNKRPKRRVSQNQWGTPISGKYYIVFNLLPA